jgi:hypothetical protein
MITFLFMSCAGYQIVKKTPKPVALEESEDSGIVVKKPTITVKPKHQSATKAITEMTGDWGPPEKRKQMFPLTLKKQDGSLETILVETERYYFESSDTHYTVVIVYNDQIIYQESIEKVIIYKNIGR